MALTSCPDCGGKVSTQAPACPHCGRPNAASEPNRIAKPKPTSPKRKKKGKKRNPKGVWGLIGFFVLFFVLMALVGEEKQNGKTAPPTRPSRTDLNATVNFNGRQFHISNRGSRDWSDCKLAVNPGILSGGYSLQASRIRSGEVYEVGAMRFTNSDGERFNPFSHKPQDFSISCKVPAHGFYFASWD